MHTLILVESEVRVFVVCCRFFFFKLTNVQAMYSCWLLLVVHQLGNGFRQQASSSFLLCSVDKVTEREQQIDHFAGDSTIGTGAGYGNAINNAPRRKLGNCNF